MSSMAGQPFPSAYSANKSALDTLIQDPMQQDSDGAPSDRLLATDASGMMTGATINFDQAVWGAYGSTPHPDAPL